MSTTVVRTQAEFDAALAASEPLIIIDSPQGVWITVEAYGSAAVRAYGSATVKADGSATVEAYESATVEAYGSATVRAYGSATVRATPYVAIHLYSALASVTGGVVIDIAGLNLGDPLVWCTYYGVGVADGMATLYKAVSDELEAGQSHTTTTYTVGAEVQAADWRADRECGHGLHFGPTPWLADKYYQGREPSSERRYLAVAVAVGSLVPLGDKAKAPSCVVLHEVDIDGERVES